jgi:putative transcriptional regulator
MSEALQDTVAFSRGELPEAPYRIHIPERIDVKAIREQTGLSQAAFANRFGLSVCTLHNWEQGRQQPDPTARAITPPLNNPRYYARAYIKSRLHCLMTLLKPISLSQTYTS